VLQPNFRGSTGFRLQHISAEFEQRALQILEDAVDGHDWLIAQGIALWHIVLRPFVKISKINRLSAVRLFLFSGRLIF
jgi:hypothetical protein